MLSAIKSSSSHGGFRIENDRVNADSRVAQEVAILSGVITEQQRISPRPAPQGKPTPTKDKEKQLRSQPSEEL